MFSLCITELAPLRRDALIPEALPPRTRRDEIREYGFMDDRARSLP